MGTPFGTVIVKYYKKTPIGVLFCTFSTVIFAYNSRSSQPEHGHASAYDCSCGHSIYVNVMSHTQTIPFSSH
jgi:hypothetical protein